jgi:hypothetical protein
MKDKYIQTLLRFDSAWKGHGLLAMKIVETFKPKTIVDLGVDWGFSTFCLAYPQIGQVYGIDWFQGDDHAGFRDTLDDVNTLYKDLNEEYGINNIEFIKADFNEAAKTWDKEIDILHIDGFHSYEAVKNDYETWVKFCKEDSIILFHDVEAFQETVGVFFNELTGYKLIHSGSAGLGILTKSEEVYNKLQNM